MAKDYFRKFRGCPSLTPQCKAELYKALSVGAPIGIACEAAGIVKDTFYRWMRGGRALHFDQESPDIPYFAPRDPDETDEAFFDRKYHWDWDCALHEDIFLTVMRMRARKRVDWMRRMDKRALEDKDMYANAWVLERTVPEEYALVTTNRKEVDAKVEVTHKHQAQPLAEAFALLGPANPALPAGQHTITLPKEEKTVIGTAPRCSASDRTMRPPPSCRRNSSLGPTTS